MRIGLTYTGDAGKHSYYQQWLQQDDAIEVVRLAAEDKNARLLQECDALVLSGGVDIHPKFYHGAAAYQHAPANGWQPERDEFEIALFQKAQELQLPVMAVCRGLQLVNTILGGTLIQDLGEALDEVHESVSNDEDRHHRVVIAPGTLLHELVIEEQADVNSAHHQAIQQLGKGLRVNARATDGTIEGIEWDDKTGRPFLLGVQWHPERMFRYDWQHTPASQKIRDRFIDAIKATRP